MRKFFAVVVLTLLASGVNALPEFDYSSYTLPDYSVKGLEFHLATLELQAFSFDGESLPDYRTNLDMVFYGSYFARYYRQKWEMDYSFGNSLMYTYYKSEPGSYHGKTYSIDLAINGSYYLTGHFFLSGSGRFEYYDGKLNQPEGMNKDHLTRYRGAAGAGYGRLYDLTTMRRAQAVIDELYSAGLLTRYPNQADMVVFGDLLYELQVGRVLDSRLKRIEDFNRIDAFLSEKKLLKEENMAYFTILNDMLTYADIGTRPNGARVKILVGTGQSRGIEKYYWDQIINTEESGPLYTATAEVEKILSRYWQWGAIVSWQGQKNERIRTGDPDIERKMSEASAASTLRWYPDTRTRASFRAEVVYQINKEYTSGAMIEDGSLFTLGLGCDIDYYFSPHLGLKGGVILENIKEYDKMSGADNSSVGTSMNLQLIYKVF